MAGKQFVGVIKTVSLLGSDQVSEGTVVGPALSHAGLAGRIATFAATAALVPAAAVAAGGTPARAAAQPATVARGAAAPGTISTIAGGVGGPAKATRVALRPCGVVAGGGYLYVNAANTVRQVNANTDWLTTPAGTGVPGPLGDTGPAAAASLNSDCGITRDHFGNEVIADSFNGRIRVVAAHTGSYYGQAMTAAHIYTVAGRGTYGYRRDGVLATRAWLGQPQGVAVDATGNLLIADTNNRRIRVVAAHTGSYYGQAMSARHIYTVAGNGTYGFAGDGGPATSAELNEPSSVIADQAGNLVIGDRDNYRIRVVAAHAGTFYGVPMTAGDIYTVAGNGTAGFSGDGGPAISAQVAPATVTVDATGNLVIADGNNRIRVVAARTGTFYGQAMTANHIYTVAGNGTSGFSGDGGPARQAGLSPDSAAVDAVGNLVIADSSNGQVRAVAAHTGNYYGQAMTAGDIYTVAGNGNAWYSGGSGPALHAQINLAGGIALDAAGNLVVADTDNNRIEVVAGSSGTFYGRAMTVGHIYNVAGGGTGGDGNPAIDASLALPQGVAVDAAGNLLIADMNHNRIRVVAGSTGTFYGQAMTAGDIYTAAGTGGYAFSGDGGPATGAALAWPRAVAVDATGNLVIADGDNLRVRVVAARAGSFYGQAMTAGHIYTVAGNGTGGFSGDGGPAISAQVNPLAVTVDAAGNLVVADGNNRIRVVAPRTGTFYGQAMTAGDIYTVAGGGNGGWADGIPATSATLASPQGAAFDSNGNLVFADNDSDRVRVIAALTGTFYGQAMTAGDIYTVAGTTAEQFSGDGGPGTSAALHSPEAVAVDQAGNLLISDSANGRIRMVTP
jgi:sugar lactone lactonase YvrE